MERDEPSGYFRIRLGAFKTEIEIWVTWRPALNECQYTHSHASRRRSRTRLIGRAGRTPTAALALDQVVTGLCQHFKEAVDAGLIPDEKWLVLLGADQGWPEPIFLPPLSAKLRQSSAPMGCAHLPERSRTPQSKSRGRSRWRSAFAALAARRAQ
jgi:hypothetical protein